MRGIRDFPTCLALAATSCDLPHGKFKQPMSAFSQNILSTCIDVRFTPESGHRNSVGMSAVDVPVGAAKQRKRYCRAECLSGFQMERWKRFLSTRTSSLMRFVSFLSHPS
jgi:hypothetical protein